MTAMKISMKRLVALLKDRSGVTSIEYGLIAALVGVAMITGATLLGDNLDTLFNDIGLEIAAQNPLGGEDGGDG